MATTAQNPQALAALFRASGLTADQVRQAVSARTANAEPTTVDSWISKNWQGEWDASGVRRDKELAKLFEANGIGLEDLKKGMKWGEVAPVDPYTNQPYTKKEDGNYYMDVIGSASGPENVVYESVKVDPRRQVLIGDKAVGFLGNINRDGNFEGKQDQYIQDSNRIGWSASGKGNVGFHVYTDAAGNPVGINSGWASSSDAGTARDVIKGAATIAAAATGINAAFAGVGAGATAGAGASAGAGTSAAASTGINWGAIGTTAGKSAATNALLTAIQGGDLSQILKSAAVGAVSSGAGALGTQGLGLSGAVGKLAGGAISAGTGAALTGGNVGRALLTSLAGNGAGLATAGFGDAISGGVSQAVRGLVAGGDPRSVLLSSLVGGLTQQVTGNSTLANGLSRYAASQMRQREMQRRWQQMLAARNARTAPTTRPGG